MGRPSITRAACAGTLLHLLAFAWPGFTAPCPSVDTSGPAPDAQRRQRRAGQVQMQVERMLLIREADRAKSLRQSKRASLIEARLCKVTTEIMRAENGQKG
jgi:hypothetical protein